jgi:hypothetical protein
MDLTSIMDALACIERKYSDVDKKKQLIIDYRKRLLEMARNGECRITRSMTQELASQAQDVLCDLMNQLKF